MKDKYEGVCIGGPSHGKEVASWYSRIRFAKMRPVPDSLEDVTSTTAQIDHEEYFHEELKFSTGTISYWRHECLTDNFEAMKFIFALATR